MTCAPAGGRLLLLLARLLALLLALLLGALASPPTSWAAPPEPAADVERMRQEIEVLVAAADREEATRAVLCLRRHGQALAPVLADLILGPKLDARAAVRLAPHVPDLGLGPQGALEVLEALAARKDIPELVVLAPLAAVGPAPSRPLTDLLRRAVAAEVNPPPGPSAGKPPSPEEEERVRRYVGAMQAGALQALARWYPHVPGITPRLVFLATEAQRPAAVRFAAALVLARVTLDEEPVMALHRSAAATAPLLARLVVATATGERLPETAAARYATLREAFLAAPDEGGDPGAPLQGLTRHDVSEALRVAGADLLPHLVSEVQGGGAGGETGVAWLTTCARNLALGWSVTPEQVWALLPPAAPESPSQAQLDAERLGLVLLARLGARAGDLVPVLSTRWRAWRQHPQGAGPCVRTEIALAAIRGAWREPLAGSVEMLERRGTQSALSFTVAASQVPDLPIDDVVALAIVKGLARGGEHRDHLLFYLARESRRVTPEARATLASAITSHALTAIEPDVRKQALQALLHLGGSLPAEACRGSGR
jgi:hypothetical protein